MSANVVVSERVYFPLCCSLKNTVYAAVISSSTDTLAVQPERKSGMEDTPGPPAGSQSACKER